MAAHLLVFAPHNTNLTGRKSTPCFSAGYAISKTVQCVVTDDKNKRSDNVVVSRRSADYKPCVWDKEYLQTIRNEYAEGKHEKRAQKIEEVRMMMKSMENQLDELEMIHVLQRLGLAYHFEEDISEKLDKTFNCRRKKCDTKDLYKTALEFKLLRQHGYNVSQDVFVIFLDENGSFAPHIRGDVKGLLSLYEASFYSTDNEGIMEKAYIFAKNCLEELMKSPTIFEEQNVAMELVSHALDMPLHWRMARLEARWYIDVYAREFAMNPIVLELAKLDFNIVQATHQQELSDLSRRWTKLGLGARLSFARDRLVEAYLWAIGTTFRPQDGYCRQVLTLAVAILTVLDDIYDVYGTLDELVIFTKAVERWDICAIEELPDYMKLSFLALFNMVNEMAYDILREQNLNVLPYLKTAWLGLLTKYLKEAEWYYSCYKPTLEEYLNIGWISVGAPLAQVLAYISFTKDIKKEALEFLESCPEIARFSSIIFRICDDLGNSSEEMKRGDVPKAIQCYMLDTGVSEEVAQKHMRELIRQTWKKVNAHSVAESRVPKPIVEMMLNITRTSHMMYQYGNGHANQQGVTTSIELSLLIQPIPL